MSVVISRRENTIGVIYLLLTALCWGFVASTAKVTHTTPGIDREAGSGCSTCIAPHPVGES